MRKWPKLLNTCILKTHQTGWYTCLSFKKFWHIVGHNVSLFAPKILNKGMALHAINRTFISLIPKIKDSTLMAHYGPTSLCNVLYKIISKILASKFKLVMDSVIDEVQSVLLLNCLVTDSAIIAFETFQSIQHTSPKQPYFLLWKWIWARHLTGWNGISWTSHGTLEFSPQISFIDIRRPLCTGTGCFRKWNISGFKIYKNGPSISHLLFVDDSLLFARANWKAFSYHMRLFPGKP